MTSKISFKNVIEGVIITVIGSLIVYFFTDGCGRKENEPVSTVSNETNQNLITTLESKIEVNDGDYVAGDKIEETTIIFPTPTNPEKEKSISTSKSEQSHKTQFTNQTIISGKVTDAQDEGINSVLIKTEGGEETTSDEFGAFKLNVKIEKNQQKILVYYKKEGVGSKSQYVGVDQRNIILKF